MFERTRRLKAQIAELEDRNHQLQVAYSKAVQHAAKLETVLGDRAEDALNTMLALEVVGKPEALNVLLDRGYHESYLGEFFERLDASYALEPDEKTARVIETIGGIRSVDVEVADSEAPAHVEDVPNVDRGTLAGDQQATPETGAFRGR